MASKKQARELLQSIKSELDDWLYIVGIHETADSQYIDYILWARSELQQILDEKPGALTPRQKEKLAKLDVQLRAAKELVIKNYPDRRRYWKHYGFPRSHWWWFLNSRTGEALPTRKRGQDDGK